ncbi:MAG: ATP-binding protein, partial [Pseudomonadales bacterium]
ACTVTALQSALATHCGNSESTDDITAVELTIVEPKAFDLVPQHPALEYETSPRQWQLSYEVRDDSLADFTPFPLLQRMLLGTPALRSRMSEIGMVVTEMYCNALEHGVLRLDSSLKQDAQGFAKYYRARSEALREARGFVRFDLSCREQNKRVLLEISVTDSGPGFRPESDRAIGQPNAGEEVLHCSVDSTFHGRGIGLLQETCQRVEHLNEGRTTKVELVCDQDD